MRVGGARSVGRGRYPPGPAPAPTEADLFCFSWFMTGVPKMGFGFVLLFLLS
jgi:hypothetical protein